jgi:protein TonB
VITLPLFGQEAAENGRTLLKRVQPQYPALAQKMSIKGVVKLDVTVEPDGSVKSFTAKGGHPVLVDAAQQAIKQWRWKPESHETVESVEIRFNAN